MKLINYLLCAIIAILALKFAVLPSEKNKVKTGRILIRIEKGATFSPEEFADASHSKLVSINPRNPYTAFQKVYLDYPVVVISEDPDENIFLRTLAKKFGYRSLSLSNNITLDDALNELKLGLTNTPKYSSDIPYLTKEESNKLYTLMKKIDEVFNKNQLTYWATAGTLLGAIRHKGLIPWDDDLDICIFDFDEKKLNSMQTELENSGLEIHHYFRDFYKIYSKDGTPIPDAENPGSFLPFKYPFADIFVVTLEKNKEYQDVYVHKSREFYFQFIGERFHYSQLENLKRIPFGPIDIPIPNNAELFLNSSYGTENYPEIWKNYAIEPSWIHKTETTSKISGTALVEIDDFSPAPS